MGNKFVTMGGCGIGTGDVAKYKLVYFHLKGRAQTVRYLLEDNGLEYELIPVNMDEWAEWKPKMLFGQLPCLMDGDLELPQSHAIIRHLARKHGLYGANDREAARIDMVYAGEDDLLCKFARMLYSGDKYEEEREKYLKELPGNLKCFENILSKNNNGNGFFVGNQITFADYAMFDILHNNELYSPGCLDGFPLLKAFTTRMASRDGIKAFLLRDDIRSMPFSASGRF